MTIGQLYERWDWAAIAAACSARWGVEVDADRLRSRCETVIDNAVKNRTHFGCCWSDCTWFLFLKSRLEEFDAFVPGCPKDDGGYVVTGRFNFFFLYLEETLEMRLALWRNENERPEHLINLAKSRLSRDLLEVVQPIDAVAARVV